jgi:PAS domain S-box-containing protein
MTANAIREAAEIFDIPGQAVIGTSLEGKIVYWNAGAEQLYGWSAAEVIGRNVLDVTPSDMSAAQSEGIMTALQQGRTWTGEFNARTREGGSVVVHVRDVPVRDSNGDLIGIIGISKAT